MVMPFTNNYPPGGVKHGFASIPHQGTSEPVNGSPAKAHFQAYDDAPQSVANPPFHTHSYAQQPQPLVKPPQYTVPYQQPALLHQERPYYSGIAFGMAANYDSQPKIDPSPETASYSTLNNYAMTPEPSMYDLMEQYRTPAASPMNTEIEQQHTSEPSQLDTSNGRDAAEDARPRRPAPKTKRRSAHNIVEQRYRNKMNAKFSVLSEIVPTLQATTRSRKRSGDQTTAEYDSDNVYTSDEADSSAIDLEGLKPARKLNKGIILAKSIEYIKFLELKNMRMVSEKNELMLKIRMLGLHVEETP